MNEQIHNAGDFVGRLMSSAAAAIPKVLGALFILLVGYIIAKVICKVVSGLLTKVRLDERLHSGHGGNVLQRAVPSPTNMVARVSFWLVFLLAISAAVGSLGVPLLTGIVAGIYAYIPKVIAAALIFLVAGAASTAVSGFVKSTMGDTETGKIVSTVSPVVIMSIAGFMILNQLMIAPAIVTITYAALLGSAGLGLALAFGLGGREVAGRIVSDAYDKGQAKRAQVSRDTEVGKVRTQKRVRQII